VHGPTRLWPRGRVGMRQPERDASNLMGSRWL